MKKKKSINDELQRMAKVYECGGGFGDPEAKEEHDRKFQLLMHQQNLEISNKNFIISIICAVTTIINVAVFIFQVFLRK